MDLPDGRRIPWKGFQTGPAVFTRPEIAALSVRLLGLSLSEAKREAVSTLHARPAQSPAGPAIIMYSATPLKKGFEGNLHSLMNGETAEDPSSYVEARSVYLASPGDLAVGRARPWRDAAGLAALEFLDIGELDHYYLSHALLKLAADFQRGEAPVVDRLVRWLREHPTASVKVYALDEEILVFLSWLRRLAGLERIYVDANMPEISERWSQKAMLHPWVGDAAGMPAGHLPQDPYQLLDAEHELTPFRRELGLRMPLLPGYTIRPEGTVEEIGKQLELGAELLRERYGLRLGCLKPSKAGTGEGIRTAVDLASTPALTALAGEIAMSGEEAVLEAHLSYHRLEVSGYRFKIAPSAHVEAGKVADGMTLQFLRGTTWEGNLYLDESNHPGVGRAHYHRIRGVLERLVTAFQQRALASSAQVGFAKCGVDFGIGRLGGRFGGGAVLALQDLNLFSHGAEYLRAFMRKTARASRAGGGAGRAYCATKVVRPSTEASLSVLIDATRVRRDGVRCEPIASVPDRWAMIAVAARDPFEAVGEILTLERQLAARRLVTSGETAAVQ